MIKKVFSKGPRKKILIVDDDHQFGKVLQERLTHNLHEPEVAETAKLAQKLIRQNEYDLVISDISMPDMNGIQLLHWIRTNCPAPVILMSGFSEVNGKEEANGLGAMALLAKPFQIDDLLTTIKSCFPDNIETTSLHENQDSNFCQISIDDFVSGKERDLDVYIRLSEGKYVKIAHSGDHLELNRLMEFKNKNIPYLYIKKEDVGKYTDFNFTLAKTLTRSGTIGRHEKVKFIKHTSEVMLQKLYTSNINREDFAQAQSVVANTVDLLSDNNVSTDLLAALATHTDHLYAHSVGVSLYSAMIGRTLGWKSAPILFKLSVGGLLHDIGKKELPQDLLQKPKSQFTQEEQQVYESHSTRGFHILSQISGIPPEILRIVHEHHENCIGTGFPSKLQKSQTYSLARVIAVANTFCNLAIKNPDSPGMTPEAAIQKMVESYPSHFDEIAIAALMQIFNISPKTLKKSA